MNEDKEAQLTLNETKYNTKYIAVGIVNNNNSEISEDILKKISNNNYYRGYNKEIIEL